MKFYILLGLSLVFCLSLWRPLPAAAQSPDAQVEFFVKSPERDQPLTVGDPITLHLEIVHPADSRVVLPQVEKEWGAFEVLRQTSPETVDNGDGTLTTGKDIVVTLFQPGEFQTPGLVITHRKSDETVEELAAPVIPLMVTSVLTEDLALRDLKPQAKLPTPLLWPWIAGIILGTMILISLVTAAALWYYHYRKHQTVPALAPVPVIDTRPPHVIAHAELDRIESLNLPAQDRIKEHYTLVAICLRRYIEGVYRIPALEQTTGEIRRAFRRAAVPVREMGGFMSLLSESDLVKFARYQPQRDDIYSLVSRARAVVDATAPQLEPAEMPVDQAEEVTS